MLGTPCDKPTFIYGDNKSVLVNTSVPETTWKRRWQPLLSLCLGRLCSGWMANYICQHIGELGEPSHKVSALWQEAQPFCLPVSVLDLNDDMCQGVHTSLWFTVFPECPGLRPFQVFIGLWFQGFHRTCFGCGFWGFHMHIFLFRCGFRCSHYNAKCITIHSRMRLNWGEWFEANKINVRGLCVGSRYIIEFYSRELYKVKPSWL